MKSTLQNILLLSAIMLIAACDSGTDGGVGDIGVSLPTPSNGASGTAVKGIVSGATVTITDATGAEVPLSATVSTAADGSYNAVFSESAIAAGLTAPLVITIDAGGATATCDFDGDAAGDNDCPIGDGTFAAFGSTYTLEDPLTLSGVIAEYPEDTAASDPVVTVNVSPASDLAVALAQSAAGGSALTANDVDTANNQVLGLIQALTGIDMTGFDLPGVQLVDITNLDANAAAAPDASYALAAFAAAVLADVDGTATNVAAVIARLKSELSVDGNGNLSGTGTNLGRLASAVARSLATVNAQLGAAGNARSAILAAAETAQSNSTILTGLGNTPVSFPPVSTPGSTSALDLTRAFVGKLSTVISSFASTTGAQGFGGSVDGATEVLADELAAAEALTSGPATQAWMQLEAAIVAAEAQIDAGGTVTDDDASDGVTFVMTNDADTDATTVTDATSTVVEGSTTVTLTIAEGVRTPNSGIEASDVVLTTSDDMGTAIQTFTGNASATFADEAGNLGLKSIALDGTIQGAGGTDGTFGVDVSASGLSGITSAEASGGSVSGDYSVTISFTSDSADDLSVTFSGDIGSNFQSFTVTAGPMITGTVTRDPQTGMDVDVLTDGSVVLTLTLDLSQTPATLVSGVFTVSGVETATIDDNGVVEYTDGSIQSLPAGVF